MPSSAIDSGESGGIEPRNVRRRPRDTSTARPVEVLRRGPHAELARERGDAVLRRPDPVRAQVGVMAADVVRAHLAAHAVARLEHRRRSARRPRSRRAALSPLSPPPTIATSTCSALPIRAS